MKSETLGQVPVTVMNPILLVPLTVEEPLGILGQVLAVTKAEVLRDAWGWRREPLPLK